MPRRRIVVRNKARLAGGLSLLFFSLLLLVGLIVTGVFLFRRWSAVAARRTLPFSSSSTYAYTGDGFMYVKGSSLHYMSLSDEDKNFSVEMNTSSATPIGSSGIMGLYNSSALRVLNTEFDTEVAGELIAARCGQKHIAICRRDANGADSIRVYDTAGSQCYQIDYSSSTLLDFGFDSLSGSVLWTIELSTNSGTPVSTITTYDLSRMSTTGIMTVQGQVVERVFFVKDSIFAACSDNLICFSRSAGREQYRLLTYGYRVVDVSSLSTSTVFLLDARLEEEHSSMRVLTVKGGDTASTKSATLILPENALGCVLMQGKPVVVTPSTVLVYDATCKLIESYETGAPVSAVEKLTESRLLFTGDAAMTLFTLKQ